MQWLYDYRLEHGEVVHSAGSNPFTEIFQQLPRDHTQRLFIYTTKSPEAVHAVYAAFGHQIPYVPVDIQAPFERAWQVLQQVKPRLVLVDNNTHLYHLLLNDKKATILWKNETTTLLRPETHEIHEHAAGLAAVLFTSGSTGIPKGVMISRQNIVAFTQWMTAEYNITKNSRLLSVSPLNFDLSVFELFAVFSKGATLHFPPSTGLVNPRALAGSIAVSQTDTLYATPTWYRLLLLYGKTQLYRYDFVKTVLVAGEALNVSLAHALHRVFPQAQIANLYGPTETNVCTYYNIPFDKEIAVRNDVVSIGKPCPYAVLQVDKEHILGVSGKTVMMGYWPLADQPTFYSTGDLVEHHNGLYFFAGRKDRLVKRNGYRIELDEVEACIARADGVQQAAVTFGGKMVAHVTGTARAEALREFCLRHLPPWMLPDVFVFHENFPLTSSGKTDYRKLAENDNV